MCDNSSTSMRQKNECILSRSSSMKENYNYLKVEHDVKDVYRKPYNNHFIIKK